ncbi:MAG: BrnT family toxin, partial [Terriglobia bacterium]
VKAGKNFVQHGVQFQEAQTVFDDPLYVDFFDPDHSDDEKRFLRVGQSRAGRFLVVSYTERRNSVRLISAREATPRERKDYEQGL